MANRRFEMFDDRKTLTRMRLGDTDRAIARAGLMRRRKATAMCRVVGGLDTAAALPDEAELARRLTPRAVKLSSASLV